MSLRMREATEADLEQISAISTQAFNPRTDVVARHLFPVHLQPKDVPDGAAAYHWRLSRKTYKLASTDCILMVVQDDALNGQVVGFSVWEPPSKTADPSKEPVVPCAYLDETAYAELKALESDYIRTHFGEGGLKDVWVLDYLAVHPQHHRRGIGRMLMNWGLQRMKELQEDIYLLATPGGRLLYRTLGFEDLGPLLLFGVDHYPMIKRHQDR